MSAVDRVVDALRERGMQPKGSGGKWNARCPAHEDTDPSLSVGEGRDGRALLRCHRGCATTAVVAALGLSMADLAAPGQSGSQAAGNRPKEHRGPNRLPVGQGEAASAPPQTFDSAELAVAYVGRKRSGPPTGSWSYQNAAGEEVGRVVRWDLPNQKKFVRPVALVDGRWVVGAIPAPRPLYRLRDVAAAAGTIIVVEGEKCVEALVALDFQATTSAGGANAAAKTDWSPLAGRDVLILPDSDDAGRKYAADVARILKRLGRPASVGIFNIPDLPDGGDVADFIDAAKAEQRSEPDIKATIEAWTNPAQNVPNDDISDEEADDARDWLIASMDAEQEGTKPTSDAAAVHPADALIELLRAENLGGRGNELWFQCGVPEHADPEQLASYNLEKHAWFCKACDDGGGYRTLAKLKGVMLPKRNKQKLGAANREPDDDPRFKLVFATRAGAVPLSRLLPELMPHFVERCGAFVYVRGGELVNLIRDESQPRSPEAKAVYLRVCPITKGRVREYLDHAVRWHDQTPGRNGEDRDLEDLAPTAVCSTFMERGAWRGIRPLLGCVHTPCLRPDGTVLDVPGYDAATRLYYDPVREYPAIPEHPTLEDVAAAYGVLMEPFLEFRLAADVDRAAILAALLTIAARPAVDGPVPFFAVRAPDFGGGKTLLAEVISFAITGKCPALMSPTGGRQADGEAEMRKRITSALLDDESVAVLDNLPDGQTFDSKAFAALITTVEWTDRKLGESKSIKLPHRTVWFVTGSNIEVWSDLGRRGLTIDIVPGVDDAHLRTFEVENLTKHVRTHHPRLLAAALTILRGYFVAGRPSHNQPKLGRFEEWDAWVRGATIWATSLLGKALDPLETQIRLRSEAPDRAALTVVLQACSAAFGDKLFTAKDAVRKGGQLITAFEAAGCVDFQDKVKPRLVGNFFRVQKGKSASGLKLVQAGTYQGAVRWRVERTGHPREGSAVGVGESGESGESVSLPANPPACAGAQARAPAYTRACGGKVTHGTHQTHDESGPPPAGGVLTGAASGHAAPPGPNLDPQASLTNPTDSIGEPQDPSVADGDEEVDF